MTDILLLPPNIRFISKQMIHLDNIKQLYPDADLAEMDRSRAAQCRSP